MKQKTLKEIMNIVSESPKRKSNPLNATKKERKGKERKEWMDL